jgi:peptide/nickel transport system ATP-binding protein
MPDRVVEARGVTCCYASVPRWRRTADGEVNAVDGVDIDLHAGETLALIGQSGSGKSTLGLCLLRLVPLTTGQVTVCGREVHALAPRALRQARRDMQMVFQDPFGSLDPRENVERIVGASLRIHERELTRAERAARIAQVLERVGLEPAERFIARRPHELSGGERQRVAIAASIVVRPRLLIADEPVSMLDASLRASVMELLASIAQDDGTALLLITHDLLSAAEHADQIAVMHQGTIVERGAAARVVSAPEHEYTRRLLGAIPRADSQIGVR